MEKIYCDPDSDSYVYTTIPTNFLEILGEKYVTCMQKSTYISNETVSKQQWRLNSRRTTHL